jgi:hypothetical protein
LDQGRFDNAYAMMAPMGIGKQSKAEFIAAARATSERRGALVGRTYLRTTWTRNLKDATRPPIYAAVDFSGRFARMDRNCGYIILGQAAEHEPFKVWTHLEASVDNETARKITVGQGADALQRAWLQAASACPNFPLPEMEESSLGYPNYAVALSALKAKAGVVFTTRQGWTLATDEKALTIWWFTPEKHPAHPSIIKQKVTEDAGGGTSIETSIQCESSKAVCDELVRGR